MHGNEGRYDADNKAVDDETQKGPIPSRNDESEPRRQGEHGQHQSHGDMARRSGPSSRSRVLPIDIAEALRV